MEKLANGALVTPTPEQNGSQFPDAILKCISLTDSYCTLLKFVDK